MSIKGVGRGDFLFVVDGKIGSAVSSSLSTRVCFGEDQRVSLVQVVSFQRLDDSEFELSYAVGKIHFTIDFWVPIAQLPTQDYPKMDLSSKHMEQSKSQYE
ncbi:hypothetical protein FNV43_RR01983 [Rhamnella rubrinervis]|uniref:Uncharacterized protein n=1 Tax=Rhamnella rubrinervis TaxID=2594499 RepID=A0A8K0MSJ5_9ROSA|nr:hypothetical protein FNV43_RR01983 [Rhamnella rubrinervis]